MRKIFISLFIIITVSAASYSQSQPPVKEIISQVNLDSLKKYVQELSGEVPVIVNGQEYIIHSRNSNYPGNIIAADYLAQKLESFGLTPVFFDYTTTGRDVYALQQGTDYPDHKYIICAHYDSMPDNLVSPGADDDASGCAAVLEAARILSQYTAKYTIMYAFWDEEEQGILGSIAWANYAYNSGYIISGVINIDMIGWDSDDDHKLWINTRDTANSVMIADKAVEINESYELGLDPQVLNPGSGSDNLPFWHYGFSAVGVEELYGSDWNDYYHTTEDKLDKFNLPYFLGCAEMTIGTLASLSEINDPVAVETEQILPDRIMLAQNYPNPFNPSTKISYQLPGRNHVTLKVYNVLGREIGTLVNKEQPAGSYTVDFSSENLAGGVYFYRLDAGAYSAVKKMILMK